MPRKPRTKDPVAAAGEIVVSLVAAIGFLAWFSPSFWATIKPFVIVGGILGAAGIAFLIYRKLNPPSSPPARAQEEPTKSSGKANRSSRRVKTPSQPQPSPALEAAITSAMSATPEPFDGPKTFHEETLRRMDWLGFEHLVVDLFNELGFHAKKTQSGADGGVDIELRHKNAAPHEPPQALVQCKARSSSMIGVDKVRELMGVVASTSASKGILVANSEFSQDARAFAAANPKLLIGDIAWLLKALAKLPEEKRKAWEEKHLGEGFDIPSCVSCETKMRVVAGSNGPFWGCPNYSTAKRCRNKMFFRKFDRARVGVACAGGVITSRI